MSETTGITQILPLLRPLPAAQDHLRKRLGELGYSALGFLSDEFSQMKLLKAPSVALVPISSRATLDQLQRGIIMYQSRFKDAATVYLGFYSGRIQLSLNQLHGIGLSGVYQSPLEDEILINKIFEIAPAHIEHKNLSLDQLIRVSIIEIEKWGKAPFDLFLYLPMNRRVILYLEKDVAIDQKTIKKFHENQNYSLYIRRSDIKLYQEFGKKLIRQFGPEEKLNEVDKHRKYASRIGGLMGGFFSEEEYAEDDGKQMLENLKAFVEDLSVGSPEKVSLEESVSAFSSQKLTRASHTQNMAAYCALFGMALGLTNPENLRMGGLLHDVGLAELPEALVNKDIKAMNPSELEKYRQHPMAGQASLAKKKLLVPKDVLDMILFHHEHTDGTGYPFRKKGSEIPPFAKVCAFADEFDKLTSLRPGHAQLTPAEAFRRIAGLDGKPPAKIYDAAFHKPLIDAFLKEANGAVVNDVAKAKESFGSVNAIKGPLVTLNRLLKTAEFARQHYAPRVLTENANLNKELEDFAQQLAAHFKARSAK